MIVCPVDSYVDNEYFDARQTMEQGCASTTMSVWGSLAQMERRKLLRHSVLYPPLFLNQETMEELNNRFALIYTGQRRLARNLLRDVVGRYIGNEPDTAYALNEIQRTAALMRFELERGNVDAYDDDPAIVMALTDSDVKKGMRRPKIWDDYQSAVGHIKELERFAFYEQAKNAYAVIQTGEERQYGNLILVKGVVVD